ncbi:MAG: uridine kinase [Ruminococcaceae bacterium]|nr:uridine kinase [Oscillospiraceae bacterium]
MGEVLVIGIAGGSGSGKTTLIERIVSEFGQDITVVSHDDYYYAHDDLTFEQRKKLNYDHPDAFDNDLLYDHLTRLRSGQAVECPVYDFIERNRSKETRLVVPDKVVIVEGILIFAEKRLCDLMDVKIFVETDADERIMRRILRDVDERGRDLHEVVEQYRTTVKPMHEQFVQPSRRNADLVVLDGGKNSVALNMIFEQIRHQMSI